MEECLSTKQSTRRNPFPRCAISSILLLGSVLYYTIHVRRRRLAEFQPTVRAYSCNQLALAAKFFMQRVVLSPFPCDEAVL